MQFLPLFKIYVDFIFRLSLAKTNFSASGLSGLSRYSNNKIVYKVAVPYPAYNAKTIDPMTPRIKLKQSMKVILIGI